MDLRLFLAVLRRFRLLVIGGAAAGLLLALVATAKVELKGGAPTLTYRKSEQWASETRLLLTQPKLDTANGAGPGTDPVTALNLQAASDARLPGLASIYANYVTSDAVQKVVLERTRLRGGLASSVIPVSANGGGLLPIVSIMAVSDTAAHSVALSKATRLTLTALVSQQQEQQNVPPNQRVHLSVLVDGSNPTLVKPHSTTLPIAIFLVVLFATIGFAFLLENLRPRLQLVPQSQMPASVKVAAGESLDHAVK